MSSVADSFCELTTIHGINYVSSSSRSSKFAKAYWLILIVAFFSIAVHLIKLSFNDWTRNPILTSIESPAASITELPFPSVTVCPEDPNLTNAERWGLVSSIIDALESTCWLNETRCQDTLDMIKPIVNDIVQKLVKNAEARFELPSEPDILQASVWMTADIFSNFIESFIDFNAENENETKQTVWNELLAAMNPINKSIWTYKEAFQHATVFLKSKTANQILGIASLNVTDCYNYLGCKSDLTKAISFVQAYLQIQSVFHERIRLFGHDLPLGLGAMFAFISPEVGYLFQEIDGWPKKFESGNMMTTSDHMLEQLFVDWTARISEGRIQSVSILDLASLFSVGDPEAMAISQGSFWANQPSSTLSKSQNCTLLADFSDYGFDWYISDDLGLDNALNHKCRSWIKTLFANHLELIMTVMSVSHFGMGRIYRGGVDVFRENILKPLNSREAKMTKFNKLPDLNLIPTNVMPFCSFAMGEKQTLETYNLKEIDCYQMFTPYITDSGICHSFNAKAQKKTFQQSSYMDLFLKTYRPKEEAPWQSLGPGSKTGLFLTLDRKGRLEPRNHDQGSQRDEHWVLKTRSKNYLVSVGSSVGAFTVARQAVVVKPGYKTVIHVAQSEVVADSSLKTLSIKERKCRFQDENEHMKVLEDFTLSGCQFECALKRSQEKCHCIPWNYPRPDADRSDLCDLFGNACFNNEMKKLQNSENCSCEADCQGISLTTYSTYEKLNPNELCRHQAISYLVDMFNSTQDYKNLMFGDPILSFDEQCAKIVEEDLSTITVELASKSFVRSIRERRTSFMGQLSSLGGTLGLFTGMSLLTLAEVCYWIVNVFLGLVYEKKFL